MYKDLCISSSSADVFTMSEGYIVLPSNASYRLFPDNSNSKFTIQLERPLVLHSDKHEVALVDLHYNNTWRNLPHSWIILESRGGKRSTVNVAGGKYESYTEVCSSIQRKLRLLKLEKRITIYHDKVTNTSYLRIRNNDRVTISEELSQVFGFESGKTFLGPTTITNTNSPDIERGFHSLYVYSSIAGSRLVGDSNVPLLGIVPRKGDRFSSQHYKFRNPHYIPAATINTDTVNTFITTDSGIPVSFDGGKVVLNVHYRLRK